MPSKRPPETGDVYSFKVGELRYLLQYIHVTAEADHAQPQFRFRGHVVVFENGYKAVPDRPNLRRIYRIKSRPKGQLLYVLLFGPKPGLPRGLSHWGRVEPSGSWIPDIELSPQMPVARREVDGVEITPQFARFQYVRGRIEDDQRRSTHAAVDPDLFPQWLETIDGAVIVQAENLIGALRDRIAHGKKVSTALATCLRALNKLDGREAFIGTIEAEDLFEVLTAEAAKGGVPDAEAAEIIDQLRDW